MKEKQIGLLYKILIHPLTIFLIISISYFLFVIFFQSFFLSFYLFIFTEEFFYKFLQTFYPHSISFFIGIFIILTFYIFLKLKISKFFKEKCNYHLNIELEKYIFILVLLLFFSVILGFIFTFEVFNIEVNPLIKKSVYYLPIIFFGILFLSNECFFKHYVEENKSINILNLTILSLILLLVYSFSVINISYLNNQDFNKFNKNFSCNYPTAPKNIIYNQHEIICEYKDINPKNNYSLEFKNKFNKNIVKDISIKTDNNNSKLVLSFPNVSDNYEIYLLENSKFELGFEEFFLTDDPKFYFETIREIEKEKRNWLISSFALFFLIFITFFKFEKLPLNRIKEKN